MNIEELEKKAMEAGEAFLSFDVQYDKLLNRYQTHHSHCQKKENGLLEQLKQTYSELEKQSENLGLEYALAKTGLKLGDIVDVTLPNGRNYTIEIENAYLLKEAEFAFYGKRILKSGEPSQSTCHFHTNFAQWQKRQKCE